MTKLVYLDLETLVVENKEVTRDYEELLSSAQRYYAKAGIKTRVQKDKKGILYLQERECKNTLMLAATEECSKQDFETIKNNILSLPYYAVARGFKPGVYRTWSQTKASVETYTTSKYKKFAGREAAKQFMAENGAPLVCYNYL